MRCRTRLMRRRWAPSPSTQDSFSTPQASHSASPPNPDHTLPDPSQAPSQADSFRSFLCALPQAAPVFHLTISATFSPSRPTSDPSLPNKDPWQFFHRLCFRSAPPNVPAALVQTLPLAGPVATHQPSCLPPGGPRSSRRRIRSQGPKTLFPSPIRVAFDASFPSLSPWEIPKHHTLFWIPSKFRIAHPPPPTTVL